jgi:PAT family beta-lactamase induction signal transducer AmpG
MDVTNPLVAATQFTAYMALLNFAIGYSATWQGLAVERWGYPVTLTIDAVAGLLPLALLPWMTVPKRQAELSPGQAIPEGLVT